MTKDFSTIQFHPGPRVASIVLNRPPLNIINFEMLEELDNVWSEVEDLKAQVAVISAAGDLAFSAGVDVADHAPGRIEATLEKFHHVILRIRKSDCVSIAAVHGYALGGGAELAMMCDLIIGADDARIGQPEISLGCYPPVAVAYLPGAIGFHKASEMVLLGEPVSAAEAERLGMINKVVPRASLNQTVDLYIDKLLTKSSTVLGLTKRALREGSGRHFESALDRAHELYVRDLTKTEDMIEGMNAFIEKRPPNWKNR
jgi:cyclohexa-1,5-dienecarbonyl-CoA hydratase